MDQRVMRCLSAHPVLEAWKIKGRKKGGVGGVDTFLKLNIKTDVKNPNCIDKGCKIPVCSALFLSQPCVQPEFIYMRHPM